MKMLIKIIKALTCLMTLCTLCVANATTPFKQCDNNKPTPLSVSIDGCSSLPCDVIAEEHFHIAVQFLANKDTSMQLSADAIMKTSTGIRVPFELDKDQRNVCANLLNGAYCSLYATEDATYDLEILLNKSVGRSLIEVNLMDESVNEAIACFITEIRSQKISPKFRKNV